MAATAAGLTKAEAAMAIVGVLVATAAQAGDERTIDVAVLGAATNLVILVMQS